MLCLFSALSRRVGALQISIIIITQHRSSCKVGWRLSQSMISITSSSFILQIIIGWSCHKYHFCRNKSFVASNTCLSQRKFCLNKYTFVTTKDTFCCDKHVFVTTKVCLSRQNYVCRDKCLSWHDKTFVATKIILVAVPTNDNKVNTHKNNFKWGTETINNKKIITFTCVNQTF